MLTFLARRVAEGIAVMFVVTTFAFFLVRLAPGDPFTRMLQDPRTPAETRAALVRAYGLDRPLQVQYVRFIVNAARGDFGPSLFYGKPVSAVFAEALPNTLVLMGTGLLLSVVGGIGLGAWQAANRTRPLARAADRASIVAASIPEFWLATVLLMVFAYRLRVLPSGGTASLGLYASFSASDQLADRLRHLVLPVSTLAILGIATIARYQRASLLEVLPNEFIRTARAKGVDERRVVYRHALRNALLPVISVVGLSLPALVGGAVFVENVFSWPGMGRIAVESFGSRDYGVVIGAATIGAALVVAGGIIADLLHAAADPRVRTR